MYLIYTCVFYVILRLLYAKEFVKFVPQNLILVKGENASVNVSLIGHSQLDTNYVDSLPDGVRVFLHSSDPHLAHISVSSLLLNFTRVHATFSLHALHTGKCVVYGSLNRTLNLSAAEIYTARFSAAIHTCRPYRRVTNDRRLSAPSTSVNVSFLDAHPKPISTTEMCLAFTRVSIIHSKFLNTVSAFIGWIYFAVWSISFYPQIYHNYTRKSVLGLNFDFLAWNLFGFFCYSLFNCSLYFSPAVKREYFHRHMFGLLPVTLADVFFALHAMFACIVTISQCVVYERATQHVSTVSKLFIGLLCIALVVMVTFKLLAVLSLEWLYLLSMISSIKLGITIVKYIPQVWMNYTRRSTVGWAIGNVLLDFIGGLFSLLQIFVDAFNYDEWYSVFYNFTKLGLGSVSISFDLVFIFQHLIYRRERLYPVLSSTSTCLDHDSASSSPDVDNPYQCLIDGAHED